MNSVNGQVENIEVWGKHQNVLSPSDHGEFSLVVVSFGDYLLVSLE